MAKRIHYCEPPDGFPINTKGRAKNAIARAVQHRRGRAKRKIIRCACRTLKRKYGTVTPTCARHGF